MANLMAIVLEKENLLTKGQVRGLLMEQTVRERQGGYVPLGHLALEFRYIDTEQLQWAKSLCARLAVPPGQARPLGYYIMESTPVRPAQLLQALVDQRETGERLGAILVRQGLLDEPILSTLLELQAAGGTAATPRVLAGHGGLRHAT